MTGSTPEASTGRKAVAIIGASSDRRKFGNRAVRAFARQGYRVVPVHPTETEIEGHRTYRSVLDIPGAVDIVSLYVPPEVGEHLLDEIARKQVAEVWINPGAESPAMLARAEALGIRPIVACSIVGIGEDPRL